MITKIISIFLCFFISTTYAGTIDPKIPDQKYIEFGKEFYCVVKLCGAYEDGTMFCASAVVIDEHHILTAAHVVKGYKTCFIIINDKKFILSKIIIHKDFDSEFGVADIALGYSEIDFGLEFYPPLYTDNDEIGKVASISGYGLTGTFNTGTVLSDNKKRAGSNRVDNIEKDLLICTPTRFGHKGHTVLEFLIGSGDSGGGLFIDGKLAGINSCVMSIDRPPMSKYDEESGHTRVSKFIDWINEHRTK